MRVSDKAIGEAIQRNAGGLTFVADEFGISLEALEARIAKSRKLQQACRNVEERLLDGSLRLVFQDIIERRSVSSAKWYLEQQGQARGFGRGKSSTTHEELRALVAQIDGDDLETVIELRKIAAEG